MPLILIEGPDYLRAQLIIDRATKTWPKKTIIWLDSPQARLWLNQTIENEDYLIFKKAENLHPDQHSDKLKIWAHTKHLIFVTDKSLKPGSFSRKLKRLGKAFKVSLGKEAREKVSLLADQLNIPPEVRQHIKSSCYSISEALSLYECYSHSGLLPPSTPAPLLLLLSGRLLPLAHRDSEKLSLFNQLAGLARSLALSEAKPFHILSEISKAAPGCVGLIFSLYQKLRTNAQAPTLLLKLGAQASQLLSEAEGSDVPLSLILLKWKSTHTPWPSLLPTPTATPPTSRHPRRPHRRRSSPYSSFKGRARWSRERRR